MKTTKEQARIYLDIIATQKEDISNHEDDIERALGVSIDYDDGIFKTMSRSLQDYVELVAEHTGISIESISWFVYENNLGKNKMASALSDGEMRVIDSIDSFLDFQYEQNNIQR